MSKDGSSVLGSKAYWDDIYEKEVVSFNEFGDGGEIWFGRKCERRMVNWLCKRKPPFSNLISIVDIGCGNASILRNLAKMGFDNLTGVDYCASAIKLATNLIEEDNRTRNIALQVVDICNPPASVSNKFDIVLDKGTFDAISLSIDGVNNLKKYQKAVLDMFNEGSEFKYLLLASCNFTEDELKDSFLTNGFKFVECLKHDEDGFTFAGQVGKTVTEVIFVVA